MAQIEIIGDDNYVLINDEFKNLILAKKQTVTFPAPPGSTWVGSAVYASVPGTSRNVPMMGIRSGFLCSQSQCLYANGQWTFQITCEAAGIGGTAELFFFVVPDEVPNANGLVQLFNAVGEIVFDSSLNYLKMTQPFFVTDDYPTTVDLPAGRTYAVVHSKLPSYFSVLPGARPCGGSSFAVDDTSQINGTSVNGTTVRSAMYTVTYRSYCSSSPSTGRYRTREGTVLIIDVTGM